MASRAMEILRKNQMETVQIKNTIMKMKNVFDGIISRLYMAEEKISDLGDTSI